MQGPMDERRPPVILSPDLIALLQEMGLTWDEVRIYQFLLNSSSAISSAIVRETGHSRGRIYESLRRLVEKGIIREEPTRPIQFRPTPLAEVLAEAHVRLTRQLATVTAGQVAGEGAADALASLPPLAPTRPRDVHVYSGRRACHAEWSRMLHGAGKFFWLTGGENLARRLASMTDFLQSLRAANENGLEVQVVLPKNASTAEALATLTFQLGADVLRIAAVDQFGPLISCATDQASMEVISQPDDDAPHRGDDVAIQVSSELFADATKKRFQLAEAHRRKTGSPPVYQWLGPNHGSDLFLEAVRGAQRDVLVLGPREWSTYLALDWKRNAETYKQAKTRGVQFRALTVRGNDDKKSLGRFADVWDIRIADWHPVWLTLVDGRELYQAFTHPSLGGPPQFRQSREPNEIKFYSTVFDRLWTQAEPV